MKFIEPVELKRFRDVVPGELFRVRWGGAPRLAIALEDEGRNHLVGDFAFQNSDNSKAFPAALQIEKSDALVISYGREWVIDFTVGDAVPGNLGVPENVYALILAPDGFRLRFHPTDIMGHELLFDPIAAKIVASAQGETAIWQWSIWQSETAKKNGKKPLYEAPQP